MQAVLIEYIFTHLILSCEISIAHLKDWVPPSLHLCSLMWSRDTPGTDAGTWPLHPGSP